MDSTQRIESCLVVGGCGSLGHIAVQQLLKLEPAPQVSVLDKQTTQNRFPSVKYYDADITIKDQVSSALRKAQPQVIFHTASPPAALADLPLYLRVNVDGTRNLLECAKEIGVKAFVYTSSASVVHDSVSDLVEGDDSLPLLFIPEQKELYSHSKALADKLVLESNSNAQGGMMTASIRPSGIFGENDPTTKAYVDGAAAGKLKYQIGNGKNLFDFTFHENVVHAHILAAQALLRSHIEPPPDDMRVAGQGFIITNDEHIPFWEFARGIGGAAGYPTRKEDVRSIPKIIGLLIAIISEWMVWITSFGRNKSKMTTVAIRYSCMTRTYRIDKAKRALGYKPLVGLQEAIQRAGRSFSKDLKKTS